MKQILSRRDFIKTSTLSIFVASLPRFLRGSGLEIDRVSIFHTTDLHGNVLPTSTYDGVPDLGGIARIGKVLKQWRQMHPASMTVDLGDLYQGTDVGLRTRGEIMIRCLNHLDFDAWIVGNHELDWGIDAVHEAVGHSRMPVLAANTEMHGAPVWDESTREESTLAPYIIKELNGYRIAFIGLTTPGMPNWFMPELTKGFTAHDPIPILGKTLAEVKTHKPDAIILGTHMGVRPWSSEDDAANRLFGITEAYREIDAIVAGHTHRDQPERTVNGIPYSQANYFGIHLGHLELMFDRKTRSLITIRPTTELMDARYGLDPEIISLTANDVEESKEHLATPVGELADQLDFASSPGNPSNYERLIGSSIYEGLQKRGIPVDAVLHGLLFTDAPLLPGEKTVADMWTVIPFENFIATASVTGRELITIVEEMFRQRNHRSLMGLEATISGRGNSLTVESIQRPNGEQIRPDERVTIALNSYDASSGGGRFTTTREIITQRAAQRTLHRLQSRALLIEFFEAHSPVRVADLI